MLQKIKEALRAKCAWPGGYPLFVVMHDGGCLCIDCARKEWRQLVRAELDKDSRGGWRALGADINWDDSTLFCDHCNERIESAYAEDSP